MEISGPRGTHDILPDESPFWQIMEKNLRQMAELYGYSEVRLPIFEHTELFERGVGDSTDIVQKEMYTFMDRGDRSLTLRPEGTASCARAFIEHRVYNQAQPTKWFYIGPMFRYDRPQAGRYRQFHQFGLEVFGSRDPNVDAEVIALLVRMVQRLGIREARLHLNTVGCPDCRPLYRERMLQYMAPFAGELCNDCRQRMDKNPLRVLDCKNSRCREVVKDVPTINSYLCDRCGQHFEQVRSMLAAYKVDYVIDSRLVRGLDYYTNTAFELLVPDLGAQAAVGGGGRYDGLIEECGGPPTPGIGFAIGLERLLLAARKQDPGIWKRPPMMEVFVAVADREYDTQACLLLDRLRRSGIKADKDYMDRSLKAQMKYAGKSEARIVVVIGEEEIRNDSYVLRDMMHKEQQKVPSSQIVDRIKSILVTS